MSPTPRMSFPYPGRDDEPWYDKFEDFVEALDAAGYAAREDRSLIFGGGGTLSWASGTLTWTSAIQVASTIGGRILSVLAGSLALTDGDVMYITLTRYPLQNITVSAAQASQIPADNNNIAFAVRIGDRVYFRTGLSLGSGESSEGVSPSGMGNYWGQYATPADLPNVAGAATQSDYLEVGSTAYSLSDSTTYQCTDATPGAAVWTAMGGGGGGGAGSYIPLGPYSYTQAPAPVEEVIGQLTFDGSLVGTSAISFVGVMTPAFTAPGWARLRLYDMGPSGGPFGVPRLVATLQRVAGGLMDVAQVLTVVAVAPGANQILDTKRVYDVVVIQSSAPGDTVYVGSVGLEVV